jgi:hypothetical protein
VLADPGVSEAIIVIDREDGNAHEVREVLHRYEQDARVTAHLAADAGERRGEQAVRDHGVALARSDVILAIDDDVIAGPGLASGHARWHAAETDRVVLGYMPVQPPESGGRWGAGTRLYAEGYERACARYAADDDSVLLGLWGGNFSVRREHWLRANELERLPVAFPHTDLEFGLRLRRLGLKGRFDEQLRAEHVLERSVARLAADAQGSAAARVRLHAAYPDLIPPPAQGEGSRSQRLLVRALVRATQRPAAWRLALGLLLRLARGAETAKLTSAEYALARLVRRLAYERELARPATSQPAAKAR